MEQELEIREAAKAFGSAESAAALADQILVGLLKATRWTAGALDPLVTARAGLHAFLDEPIGNASLREAASFWLCTRAVTRERVWFVALAEDSIQILPKSEGATAAHRLRVGYAAIWDEREELAKRLGIEVADVARRLFGARSAGDALNVAAGVACLDPRLAGQEGKVANLLQTQILVADWETELAGKPQIFVRADELSDLLTRRARIRAESRRLLWNEPMMKGSDVAEALGIGKKGSRERLRLMRGRSELLALKSGREFVYPAFQIDSERRCVRPEAAEANRLFAAAQDPWGTAASWITPNSRLEARPCDLIATERADEIVRAATAAVEEN